MQECNEELDTVRKADLHAAAKVLGSETHSISARRRNPFGVYRDGFVAHSLLQPH